MNDHSILLAALQIDDIAERAQYLDRACGGDSALRERVDSLLRDHHGFEKLICSDLTENQTVEETSGIESPSVAECPGSMIGPYRLLEQIGKGGMGVVFVAEQQKPVRRKVALKLIKPGMDTREVVARFEHERQALALMDHPNIARVLDAGSTDSGRPYFVMEFVRGIPITDYCDQNRLTPRERLELFGSVCHAVQHAHQKGIIHRDLKPSNVLVALQDGRSVVKVIDFGIAKAINQQLIDKTVHTRLSQLIGTPLYMSPEQAEMSGLDIDTRSDIYSLGVMLYELLTGSTPFDKQRLSKASYDEVRRIIREEEPPKPSTRLTQSTDSLPAIAAQRKTDPVRLSKLVRGDLDWIVMKCLEKDRSRRYDTANALARDVERYLRDEPVEAGPPTLAYQMWKFGRRYRSALLTSGTVCVLLVAATTFSAWQAIRATRAESETRDALRLVIREQAKTQAALEDVKAERSKTMDALSAETKAWRRTREALNSMTDDVIATLFLKQSQLGDSERAFLKKIIGFYEQFSADRGETEEARAIAADGHYRVARMRQFLGELPEAEARYRRSSEQFQSLLKASPGVPLYRHTLALSQMNLGIVLEHLDKRSAAGPAYDQAASLLDALVTEFPNSAEYRKALVKLLNNQGALLSALRQVDASEAKFRQAVDVSAKLAADFPSQPELRHQVARARHNLASRLRNDGKFEPAAVEYRQAIVTLEKLAEEFPQKHEYREDLALCRFNLGRLLKRMNELTKAAAEFRLVLPIQESLASEFPGMHVYRFDLSATHNNLAKCVLDRGERAREFRNAVAIQEKLAADFPHIPEYRRVWGESLTELADVLTASENYPDAESTYRRALAIQESLVADHSQNAEYRSNLAVTFTGWGRLLKVAGRLAESQIAYEKGVAIHDSLVAENPHVPDYRHDLAATLVDLCGVVKDVNHGEASLRWFDKTVDALEAINVPGPDVKTVRRHLRQVLLDRAQILTDLGRLSEAAASHTKAEALAEGHQSNELAD